MVTNGCAPDPPGVDDTQVVPLLVKTLPKVLGATACIADVRLPNNTLFAARVADPVPQTVTAATPVDDKPSAKNPRLRACVILNSDDGLLAIINLNVEFHYGDPTQVDGN
jgi:hypothetical protein